MQNNRENRKVVKIEVDPRQSSMPFFETQSKQDDKNSSNYATDTSSRIYFIRSKKIVIEIF
jgi:hypothetical protein